MLHFISLTMRITSIVPYHQFYFIAFTNRLLEIHTSLHDGRRWMDFRSVLIVFVFLTLPNTFPKSLNLLHSLAASHLLNNSFCSIFQHCTNKVPHYKQFLVTTGSIRSFIVATSLSGYSLIIMYHVLSLFIMDFQPSPFPLCPTKHWFIPKISFFFHKF